MSIIQQIRDKGAWIMFGLIAIALLSFILQDRALGGGRGGIFTNTSTLGKINGVTIDHSDFEDEVAMYAKLYGQQAGSKEQQVSNVWNQEVEKIISGQEYDKLGLVVSDRELSDILFDPNQSPLKREFTDEATGQFNVAKARDIIRQVQKSKNAEQIEMVNEAYLKPTIQQKLKSKYNDLLQQSAYVPKWLVEKTIADNNSVSSISYVAVSYSTIVDSTIKPTDDEILDYAKKHHNEYDKDEETRGISFVSFDATPSADDSAATLTQVTGFKNDFAATKDEKAYLGKVGTEISFRDSYFSKAKLESAKKDSIIKLSVGQTYGPYIEGNNYVIAKLIGTKQWPDSAKVRHILIQTNDPRSGQIKIEDTVAKKRIDSIEAAIKAGANFEALCLKYSDDPGSKNKGGVYDFFPQGQMVGTFNDFAFDKPVGSKGVVKTEYGYHYIEVLGQKNPQPAYKVAFLAKSIIASSETVSNVSTAASQFSATSKTLQDFDDNAKKLNKNPQSYAEIKENDTYVGAIGQSRQLVKWVSEHKKGEVSEPFEVGEKFVVAIITSVNKPGLPDVSVLRPQVENSVRNLKKAKQIIDSKFNGGSTLEALSKSAGTPVTKADSVSFANGFIPGLGMENKVVGAAFNKNLKGKVSEPIAGQNGVYAIRVENIGAKQSSQDPQSIKQSLTQMQKYSFNRGGDVLKKAATIKDYRSNFY